MTIVDAQRRRVIDSSHRRCTIEAIQRNSALSLVTIKD